MVHNRWAAAGEAITPVSCWSCQLSKGPPIELYLFSSEDPVQKQESVGQLTDFCSGVKATMSVVNGVLLESANMRALPAAPLLLLYRNSNSGILTVQMIVEESIYYVIVITTSQCERRSSYS